MIPTSAAVAVLLGAAFAVPSAGAPPSHLRLPTQVTVETARGSSRLAVTFDSLAGPVLPGEALVRALSGSIRFQDPWVEITLARQTFRFLAGAPVYSFNDHLQPLAGWAYRTRDSLFLPLQWVTEILPQVLAERYAWDAIRARLLDTGPAIPTSLPIPVGRVERMPNGLLPGHVVTVDAGHGGVDPGNPGLYFPRGIREKDVTLQVGLLLRDELTRRGIKVVMTRQVDTLIGLLDRTGYCTAECDLFVSLHVDALDTRYRARFAGVRGFHTIIIGEENTEDADRIARMENEALRYESEEAPKPGDDLGFILRNLQLNEFLRESARAAELVQREIDRVHTGDNRGVKQSNRLAVLNTARRPAILVEMGYSTNREDARLLTRRKSQRALATAIADAIVDYLLEYERKTGAPAAGGGR